MLSLSIMLDVHMYFKVCSQVTLIGKLNLFLTLCTTCKFNHLQTYSPATSSYYRILFLVTVYALQIVIDKVLSLLSRPFERTIVLQKDSAGHVGFVFKNGKITQIAKDTSAAR